MRLRSVCLALLLSTAAVYAVEQELDGVCEFASTSPAVLVVSQDVSRVSSFARPVKFLFDNKKCTDFMLCVEDPSLSGGSGCTVTGARSESSNVCSLKGTNRGDDKYMLALNDPNCKGLDLVNCLSISVQGNRLQISQTCAAKIGALTFTCLGCQPATSPASGAIVAAAQDGAYNAQHKKCNNYGWCGTCDCPPIPPPPDKQKTCVAACAGRSTCQPIDSTLCRKIDTKTCEARDTTKCNLECSPPPPPTDVTCPPVRAKAVLVVEKLNENGDWVVQNVNGENPYTVDAEKKPCPQCPQCTGPGSLCRVTKTGSCTPVSSGSCTCQKDGICDVQAGPARTEVVTCPSKGGTSFYPCDGGCKPQYIPIPCEKDKYTDGKDKYPAGTKPYPPDFGYPNDGYGYPKDGNGYPKDGYPKDGYGYPQN